MRRSVLMAAVCGLAFGVAGQAGATTIATVRTSNTGGIVLPGFNSSLGELIRASVVVSFTGTTGATSAGDSGAHNHGFSFNVGPFSFSGTTGVAAGPTHAHAIGDATAFTFTDPGQLASYFQTGSGVRLAAPSSFPTLIAQGSGVPIHRHWVLGNALRFDATTHFTYEPFVATPEPSTLAMGGIAGLMGLGYTWRRRRSAA